VTVSFSLDLGWVLWGENLEILSVVYVLCVMWALRGNRDSMPEWSLRKFVVKVPSLWRCLYLYRRHWRLNIILLLAFHVDYHRGLKSDCETCNSFFEWSIKQNRKDKPCSNGSLILNCIENLSGIREGWSRANVRVMPSYLSHTRDLHIVCLFDTVLLWFRRQFLGRDVED
jgi:hypothetical protein